MATLNADTIGKLAESLPRPWRAAAETLIEHAPHLRAGAVLPILRRIPIGWTLAGLAVLAAGYAAYNGSTAFRHRADA